MSPYTKNAVVLLWLTYSCGRHCTPVQVKPMQVSIMGVGWTECGIYLQGSLSWVKQEKWMQQLWAKLAVSGPAHPPIIVSPPSRELLLIWSGRNFHADGAKAKGKRIRDVQIFCPWASFPGPGGGQTLGGLDGWTSPLLAIYSTLENGRWGGLCPSHLRLPAFSSTAQRFREEDLTGQALSKCFLWLCLQQPASEND